jgi:hypothetical protein
MEVPWAIAGMGKTARRRFNTEVTERQSTEKDRIRTEEKREKAA